MGAFFRNGWQSPTLTQLKPIKKQLKRRKRNNGLNARNDWDGLMTRSPIFWTTIFSRKSISTMKTPIEELIAFAEKFGGLKFSDREKSYFRLKEKMEQQMAYNAGYDYAVRKIQEKIKWSDES